MIYRLFLVLALLLATSPAHAGYFGPAVASVTPTAPNAPTSVSASVASATSATITWTNSTVGYPAPTYDLYRGTTSGGETLWQSSVTSPYTATGLTTDQIYWFYLKATNSAGTSAASNEVSVTPSAAITAPGAPTGVTATAGNAQATVTFSAPASNGGSAITGYTVTSSPAGGTDSNAGSTSLSHVVTGLTNGTAYTFTVTATNTAGTSAASSASNSVTPSASTTGLLDFETTSLTPTGLSTAYNNEVPASATRDNTVYHGGTYSMKMVGVSSGSAVQLSRSVTFPASGTVTFDRWFKFTASNLNNSFVLFGVAPDQAVSGWRTLVAFGYGGGSPTTNRGVYITSGNYATSTNVVPYTSFTVGEWYRVKIDVNLDASTITTTVYNSTNAGGNDTTGQIGTQAGIGFNTTPIASQNLWLIIGRSNAAGVYHWFDDVKDGI